MALHQQKKLLRFPCDFPIKVMGKNDPAFITDIVTIVKRYFPNTADTALSQALSKNQRYVSLTVTLHVLDQDQLDAMYCELSAHPQALMVL